MQFNGCWRVFLSSDSMLKEQILPILIRSPRVISAKEYHLIQLLLDQ